MPDASSADSKILVADDHELLRVGLAEIVRSQLGFQTVVQAPDFGAARSLLADPAIKVAIVDLSMPGLAGAADLESVRRQRPDVRLIVLSGSEDRDDILAALAAGVHGYIVKSIGTRSLVSVLKSILAGNIYVPPSLAELPDEPAKGTRANDPGYSGNPGDGRARQLPTLTERQREVLAAVAAGLSNKEIAIKLKISEGTVKMHVAGLLRATGARNRAQAAAIGRQLLG